MAQINTVFRYEGDFGPLKAQIKSLSGDISALNAQFKSFETIATKAMYGAAKSFRGDVSHIAGYKTSVVDLTSVLDKFGTAITRQKLSLREYAKEAANAFKSTSSTRLLAEREVARMQSSLIQFGASTGKGMLVTPLANNMSDLATRTAIARKQFDIFNTLVQDGATKLINFGKNTQWAGRQLMVGLTLPMAIFGQTLVKSFTDAETELTRFAKVYGSDLVNQSYEATEQMKGQVKALSRSIAEEWGVAVKQTNALAADLAAAGYEGQRLLDMTYQTSRLAILGEVDRQDAMKATLSLQNAFNMSTQQLSDSINFLNSVENQTSTSLQDLITAIPRTGPIINALGGDVKDLSVLLVAMKEGGVSAAEGANALKSGLASLINPTQKAIDLAKQYGVDLKGIVEGTRGELMPTVIGFQDALKNLDEFARAKVIEQIFGKYQFARISALFDNLNQQGSQTKKVLDLAKMSTTDLAKQAYREMRILTESIPNRLKRATETLKAELLPLGASIAETVIPIIVKIADAVKGVMEFLDKLPKPLKTFLKFSAVVVALLGPIIQLVGLFGNFAGNVIKLTMNMVNLGRAMLGIKTERFKLLSDDELAATKSTQTLTTSFLNQEQSLNMLNTALNTYLVRLREIRATQPGLFIPTAGGAGPMRGARRADGGPIYGPGGPTGDKIPAMLSDGEYVIKASSVNKYGLGFMDKINAGKFAMGGIVKKFQNGGAAATEKTHIAASTGLISPTQAQAMIAQNTGRVRASALNAIGTALFVQEKAAEKGLANFTVHVELLNNLVVNLSRKLNQNLKDSTVALDRFVSEFSSSTNKWLPALSMAKIKTDEFADKGSKLSLALAAYEKKIIENLQATGKRIIGDQDVYAAQSAAQKQVTAAQRKLLQPIFNLANELESFRISTDLTKQQLRELGFELRKNKTTGLDEKVVRGLNGSFVDLAHATRTLTAKSYQSSSEQEALKVATQKLIEARSLATINEREAVAATAAYKANLIQSGIISGGGSITPPRRQSIIASSLPIVSVNGAAAVSSGNGYYSGTQAAAKAAPPAIVGTGAGGGQMLGAALSLSMLPSMILSLKGMNKETDKATKYLNLFTTALMAFITFSQLKGLFNKGMLAKTVTTEAGTFATGLGGAMQRGGASLTARGGAMAAKGPIRGLMGRGMGQLGGLMTRIGPGLANPYVLAGVAAIAVGTAIFIHFRNEHRRAMQEVKNESKAAFASATESAKMYGITLNGVNQAITKNASAISKNFSTSGRKSKVADKDLIHVVEKDFSDLVKNVASMTNEEAQNQLRVSMMSLVAQGFKPQDALEIINEVARQAKQSKIMSKAFNESLLNISDLSVSADNAIAVLEEKFSQAKIKFGGDPEKLGIAMAENLKGGLDLATQIMATDPEQGARIMKFLYGSEEDLNAGAAEITNSIRTAFAAQGGKKGDAVFDFFGDPTAIETSLGQAMDMYRRFGGSYATLEEMMTKYGREGTEQRLQYINSEMLAQNMAQKALAANAAKQKGYLEEQRDDYIKAADAAMQRVDAEIEAEDDLTKKRKQAWDDEKYRLNKRKDLIQKNADAYIEALQKQSDAEDFYATQRETTLEGLKSLAGGDIFGFAQARERLQSQAADQGRKDAISRLEATRDAALEAIDARLTAIEDAERMEDRRHERAIANLNAEKDAILANKNLVVSGYQNAIELLTQMQTAGYDDQQALLVKFDQAVNKDGGPVKNAQKGLQFFDDKWTTTVKDNIAKTPGIFASIPKSFATGLKTGMAEAAGILGVDEAVLSQMIYSGLSKEYQAQIPELATGAKMPTSPTKKKAPTTQYANGPDPGYYKGWKFTWDENNKVWRGGRPSSTYPEISISNSDINSLKRLGIQRMMASGGFVSGAGNSTSDSIPAMLSNGEFVMNARAVKRIGLPNLQSMNAGMAPGYNLGGLVAPSYSMPSMSSAPAVNRRQTSQTAPEVTYNNSNIVINAGYANAEETVRIALKEQKRFETAGKMTRGNEGRS
jgi:TP901 family phage tail tape measure protein